VLNKPRYKNLILSEQAMGLLRTSSHYGKNADLDDQSEITIPSFVWSLIQTSKTSEGQFYISSGPYYNFSYWFLSDALKMQSCKIFVVAEGLVAVHFAPYIEFNEDEFYQMEMVGKEIVIYPKSLLEALARN
jgi:hypothetical protein